MTTEQQQFIDKNNAAIKKAKKTGKFTRLSSGQYYLHAQGVIYYVSKREFLTPHGWNHEWTWCEDGKSPNDCFGSLAECKSALYEYLDSNKIVHSITETQYCILSAVTTFKGKVMYFYDQQYKTPGAKNAVKSLQKKGLVEAKMCASESVVQVWYPDSIN